MCLTPATKRSTSSAVVSQAVIHLTWPRATSQSQKKHHSRKGSMHDAGRVTKVLFTSGTARCCRASISQLWS